MVNMWFRFRVCFDLSFVWRFGSPETGVQVMSAAGAISDAKISKN
jgi:hypothetical protein